MATFGVGSAASISTTGGVRSGPLTLALGPSASLSTTLSGDDLVLRGELSSATVVDATGSGTGWKLTIAGTPFKNAAGKVLPSDALVITGLTTVRHSGREPANTVTYPLVVPLSENGATPVRFAAAAPDSGMGRFTLTPAIALTVPADTYAGDYGSTLTISVVAGP